MNDDLKVVLESCTAEERSEAAAYLRVLERIEDEDFKREMARRSVDLREGRHRLSAESVSELDRELSNRGL